MKRVVQTGAKLVQSRRLIAKPRGNVADADCYILLGFGLAEDADGVLLPGVSNLALAQWLLANNPQRKQTVTQLGAQLALQQLGVSNSAEWIILLPHNDQVHVDTYGAALQIWLLAEQYGWRTPCLITHPYQSQRAALIFDRLPFDSLVIPDLTDAAIPWTKDSTQIWTRNKVNYLVFERLLARPIGRILGWF